MASGRGRISNHFGCPRASDLVSWEQSLGAVAALRADLGRPSLRSGGCRD